MIVKDPVPASESDDSISASSHGCGECSQMLSEAARMFMSEKMLTDVSGESMIGGYCKGIGPSNYVGRDYPIMQLRVIFNPFKLEEMLV